MKIPIIFNIDAELVKEIKKLPNRSGFLNDLLNEHYNKYRPIKEVKAEKIEQIKTISKEVKEIETIEQEVEKEKLKKEEELKNNYEKEKNSPERWERVRLLQKDAFEGWNVPKDSKELIFEDFFEKLKLGKVKNMIDYMTENGITKKEKRKDADNNSI